MAKGNNDSEIEKKLWEAADQLRANSELSSQEYSVPVLGLIFLRYADHKFTEIEKELKKQQSSSSRRKIGKADYQSKGVMYLPEEARYSPPPESPRRSQHRQGRERRNEGHRVRKRRTQGRPSSDLYTV